ncbi:MAG: hypothetical protein EPN84_09100 [Legionella sp.]|nr:MAG: hypothetical protein EPN84_09100 [Legionella sp.]
MNLKKIFPWVHEAWHSYTKHHLMLWWPLSFLFLTPLAVLIVFGGIIPFGLNSLGWITFNHKILNYPYMLIVAGLVFCAWFPFIDGIYRLINDCLQGKPVTEDTAFHNLFNSQDMGKALGAVFIILFLLNCLGALFKPLTLLVLLVMVLTLFTPLLLIKDNSMPWQKGLESVKLALQNKKLVAQVWGLRLLVTLAIFLPWIIVAGLGGFHTLKMIAALFALPAFVYLLIKLLPFYFYYPAYVYERMK